jgi:hypothetical protein
MQNFFRALMLNMSETLNVPMEFDTETQASVNLGSFPLLIQYLPGAEQMLAAAPIAEVAVENREKFYQALLQGQYLFKYTGGGTLSLDPEGRFVCLQVCQDIRMLNEESCVALLENFLRIAEYWQRRCMNIDSSGGGEARDEGPEAPELNNMLRV